jgi:predicted Zn-dependent peptidase
MLALIERHFKRVKPGPAFDQEGDPFSPKNPPFAPRTIIKEQKQSVVSCAFPLAPISRREYVLVSLIENILGHGPGSRIWGLRTEKKLAYSISAMATPFRHGGLFEAYLETDAAKTDASKEALAEELRRFYEEGISTEEFLAGKAVLRADFLRANETKSNRVSTLGFFESSGLGADFFDQFAAELSAVTLEEANAAIKRLLDPARASWVIVGPKR